MGGIYIHLLIYPFLRICQGKNEIYITFTHFLLLTIDLYSYKVSLILTISFSGLVSKGGMENDQLNR